MTWLWIVLSLTTANASEWAAIDKNNDGAKLLMADQNGEAYKRFIESLAESPFSPAVRLNLGVTFAKNEEFQKAFKEYLTAHKYATNDEFRFFALFNAAEVLGRQKQVEEALKYYQAALEIRPESLETKTNIELLIQQGGGGGGKGDNKDQKSKDGEQEKEERDENQEVVNRREQKPKPFESKELTKKDVEKILEELTNQENKVRAQQNDKSDKERPREKDW